MRPHLVSIDDASVDQVPDVSSLRIAGHLGPRRRPPPAGSAQGRRARGAPLIRVTIDVGFTQAQPSVLAEAVAGLVALAFVRGLFTFLQGYLAERASQGVAYDLRDALFAQIEHLSFSYYDPAGAAGLAHNARDNWRGDR